MSCLLKTWECGSIFTLIFSASKRSKVKRAVFLSSLWPERRQLMCAPKTFVIILDCTVQWVRKQTFGLLASEISIGVVAVELGWSEFDLRLTLHLAINFSYIGLFHILLRCFIHCFQLPDPTTQLLILFLHSYFPLQQGTSQLVSHLFRIELLYLCLEIRRMLNLMYYFV